MYNVIEGKFITDGKKYAIAVSRWNEFIVNKLLEGALDAFRRHAVKDEDITVVYCAGSFELPLVVQKLAQSKKYDAVVALGAVIRGATPHFDFISAEVTKGIAAAGLEANVPTIFGVLTTDNIDQAIERSGTKSGNKGFDAAMSAIEMADLFAKI